jgi:hypothetical protein
MNEALRERRLKELRRVAEAIPPARLNMNEFGKVVGDYGTPDCRTVCCLAGHAALDPWHQKHTEILDIFRLAEDEEASCTGFEILRPVPRCLATTFRRLATLYGISETDADALFAADACGLKEGAVTKAEIVANIDLLLAGLRARPYKAISQSDEDEDEGGGYYEDGEDDEDDEDFDLDDDEEVEDDDD